MKLTVKLISLICLVWILFGQRMENEIEEVVFPEFVCLTDDEDGVVDSEMNISALNRMFQPEDFGAGFR